MANIKHYQLQGVGKDVQFGKSGGRIVFNSDGSFSLVTPTGSTLARLQTADPVNPTDVVNLGAMTKTVDHVYAKLDRTSAAVTTQLTAMKSAISTLILDEVKASDGSYLLVANTSGLALETPTGTFGTFTTGSSSNSAFQIDTSVSGEVRVIATSSATSADIRLMPHGTGGVIIGDGSQDGLIQPEAGHNLTIAGGDAATAGSVIIRAGQGATANGHVEVHDVIDPTAPQDVANKNYVDVSVASSASSASAALTAAITAATTQINSSAETAIANAETTAKSYTDSSIATLSASSQAYTNAAIIAANIQALSESVRASCATFQEASGNQNVMNVPNGTLLRVKVLVTTVFTAGAAISVLAGSIVLAPSSVIDESQTGLYTIELLQPITATPITVSITTTGTVGAAMIVVEYIAA